MSTIHQKNYAMQEISLSLKGKWIGIFIFLCLVILFTEYQVTLMPEFKSGKELFLFAVSFDLLIFIPLLYYFLLVRTMRLPIISLIPGIISTFGLAYLIIPAEQQQYIHYAGYGLVALEAGLLIFAILKARKIVLEFNRLSKIQHDFILNIHLAFAKYIGDNAFVHFLVSELVMLRFGLFFWLRGKKQIENPNEFSIHHESGFPALFSVLIFVSLIEIFVMHLLISRWNGVLALVLTLLGIYSFVFMLAHLFSVIRRRISLLEDRLIVRIGMIWNFEIERKNIGQVEKINEADRKDKTQLNTSRYVFTQPNILIRLIEPISIRGIYGFRKKIHNVCLYVDQPNGLLEKLKG